METSSAHTDMMKKIPKIKPSIHRAFAVSAVIVATTLVAAPGMAFAAQGPDAERCIGLSRLPIPDMVITASTLIPDGPAPSGSASAALTGSAAAKEILPAHCKVEGTLRPRVGAGGVRYGIGFELRMPLQWSGRFLYQGGGGMDGVVNPAIGPTPVSGSTAASALKRGYAVISTDSGHQAENTGPVDFGADQQAKLDYSYAAIGKLHDLAVAFMKAFYDTAPHHSYFAGCSNGGREALMAAQRFPDDFDGIVAGSPGFRLSHATIGEAWRTRAFLKAAPLDSKGKPILAASFSKSDLSLVAGAVLAQCDAADGLKDGSIEAMSACHFTPKTLSCKKEKNDQCLSTVQVQALETAYDTPRDSKNNALYSDWAWDTGIAADGWRAWVLGNSTDAAHPDAVNATMGMQALSGYFMYPTQPGLQVDAVNFDKVAGQVAQTAAINDATGTMYSTFKQRGGKLVFFEGNSDPVFSSNDLRAYLDQLAKDNGGATALADWSKAFFVPGMTHCGGGQAMDDFDPLTAVQHSVEDGQAPSFLLAKGNAFPGRSRPLCPYPTEARYDGKGNPNLASSFSCAAPLQSVVVK